MSGNTTKRLRTLARAANVSYPALKKWWRSIGRPAQAAYVKRSDKFQVLLLVGMKEDLR